MTELSIIRRTFSKQVMNGRVTDEVRLTWMWSWTDITLSLKIIFRFQLAKTKIESEISLSLMWALQLADFYWSFFECLLLLKQSLWALYRAEVTEKNLKDVGNFLNWQSADYNLFHPGSIHVNEVNQRCYWCVSHQSHRAPNDFVPVSQIPTQSIVSLWLPLVLCS